MLHERIYFIYSLLLGIYIYILFCVLYPFVFLSYLQFD